jgi:hypothetical protein
MPHRPGELRSACGETGLGILRDAAGKALDQDRIAGPLPFARLRGSLDRAIYGSRDIINLVFTCLPDKNCPHRDRAAASSHIFFWYSFSFLSHFLGVLIGLKTLHGHWGAKSQQFLKLCSRSTGRLE